MGKRRGKNKRARAAKAPLEVHPVPQACPDGFTAVDGALMEGGGQVLRNSFSYAALRCMPVHVANIRAGRRQPGLKAQHMTGLKLVAEMCGGELLGATIRSNRVLFTPHALRGGEYEADTHTAGSTVLLLQVALPCALFADGAVHVVCRGGTNVIMAPQIDFVLQILLPTLARMGVRASVDVTRRGYFPQGRGIVELRCEPHTHLDAITLTTRGDVVRVTGRAFVAGGLPGTIALRMAEAAERTLRKAWGASVPVTIDVVEEAEGDAWGRGTGIWLCAHTAAGCMLEGAALGAKGVPAEQVGGEAADTLLRQVREGGCVDEWLQDQLIIFMALARGRSTIRTGPLTLHTKTALHFAHAFTGVTFEAAAEDDGTVLISCEGLGYERTPAPPTATATATTT